jgi:hypothetical protein
MGPNYIAAARAAIIKIVRDDLAKYAVREKAYQKKRRAEQEKKGGARAYWDKIVRNMGF